MSDEQDKYNVTFTPIPFDISCDMQMRMLPARDGVKLHTVLYFPPGFDGQKVPVLIIRTPYCNPKHPEMPDRRCLEHGIVYVLQSCRGTGCSEGFFDPANPTQERDDVEDLFNYLSAQPWFNGRCVMYGSSYTGWVQWGAAMTNFKGLVAIAPKVAPIHSCFSGIYYNGNFRHEMSINWIFTQWHRRIKGFLNVPDYESMGLMEHLPFYECDMAAGYGKMQSYRNYIRHYDRPGPVVKMSQDFFKKIGTPAYIYGGWFDPFKDETIRSFQLMKSNATTNKARNFTRLCMGPWEHAGLINPDLFTGNAGPEEATKTEERFIFGLLDKPDVDPIPDVPQVRYYVIGTNEWRNASSWPPENVTETRFYLHSTGNANKDMKDGMLDGNVPSNEKEDQYTSNPANPTLSCGGKCTPLGCYDRAADEKRDDVLTYTTTPMGNPLEIAGQIKLHFFASASTPDTDFCAILTMLMPDGRSMFLTAGCVRARFRNSLDSPSLIVPGKIYEYELDLSHIAVTIKPGYALRLELCGQYYPTWNRNPNTGNSFLTDTELKISHHRIYHDAMHHSYLEMPVALLSN